MIRVLHLVAGSGDARAWVGDRRGVEMVSRRIGRGGDYRSIVDAALAMRFRDSGQADLIHAWDERAVTAAAMAGKPVVFSPAAWTPANLRRAAWAMRWRLIDVVCATKAERDACVSHGIPAVRCHVIRPGVSMAAVEQKRRGELRERLGIGREDFVLLAPGESSYAADHRLAVHVASILHVLDRRFRVLLLGRGQQAASATELGRRLDQPRVVIRADQMLGDRVEFDELAPAADVALVTARQIAPVLPWAMCMAAGLPIVSADGRQAREVFADAAAIVQSPGPRTLANRVLALSEDPTQARHLGQLAAMRAEELFGRERFVDEYHALYARLCQTESATEREVQRASELSRMTVTGPSLTR